MVEVNAKAVQLLLTEPEEKLQDFSDHFNIPMGTVKGLRMFWSRALTGKCTACGTQTKGARKCRTCKRRNGTLLDPRSSVALLREMDKRRPVYETGCATCGGRVWWSAGDVLYKVRRYGFFRPPDPALCHKCLEEERHRVVPLKHYPFEDLMNER